MKVIYEISEDYQNEQITVVNDEGKQIAQFITDGESPEDNSLSRMGVLSTVTDLIKELTGANPEIIN
jgi:hypothetical protein